MISTQSILRDEPYRLLFPMGYFSLLFGLGIWSINLLGQSTEAARVHAILLGNGFLFAFSAGILLTEVPALLRTPHMGLLQLGTLLFTMIGMGVAAVSQRVFHAELFHLLSMANLALFLGMSLLGTGVRGQPGPTLVFAGSLISLAGTSVFLLSESFSVPREFGNWGLVGGFQGYFFLFVFACLRWSRAQGFDRPSRGAGLPSALAFLAVSLALEAAAPYSPSPEYYFQGAYLFRAMLFAWLLVRPKGVFSITEGLSVHGFFVRLGALSVFAGALLAAVNPARTVLYNHVSFIGGFAWVSLAAATAVIARRIKAGGRKTGIGTLTIGGLLLAAALAFRIAAGYSVHRTAFLGLAGFLALVPVFIWAVAFFPSLADTEDSKLAAAVAAGADELVGKTKEQSL